MLAQNGPGGGKEAKFVGIKTMKPPTFKGGNGENFQAWLKKAKNYFDANCDGHRTALNTLELATEEIDEFAVDALGVADDANID